MKRRTIFKLLLLLFAGAIINVAVAWGCAGWADPSGALRIGWFRKANPVFQNDMELGWVVKRADGLGWTGLTAGLGPSRSPGSLKMEVGESVSPYWCRYPAGLDDDAEFETNFHSFGWPLRTLMYRWDLHTPRDSSGNFKQPTVRIANGIELVDFKPRAGVAITGQRNLILLRALPYEPIWPGFSINTIFYAAIVWMLFVFPLVLRRHVRRKRGQCAACGYSLRKNVSEKCPECGVAIGSVPRPFGSG